MDIVSTPSSDDANGVRSQDRAAAIAGAGRGKRSMRNMGISLAAIMVPILVLLGAFALIGGNGLLGNTSGNTVEPGGAYANAASVMQVHPLKPVPEGWRILNAAAQQQGDTIELQLGLNGPDDAQARIVQVPPSAEGSLVTQISGSSASDGTAEQSATAGSGQGGSGASPTASGEGSGSASGGDAALPQGRVVMIGQYRWMLVSARGGQQALYSLRPKVAMLVIGTGGLAPLRTLATTLK